MKITMLSFGYELYPENYQDEFYIYHCLAKMYKGSGCIEIFLKDVGNGGEFAEQFEGGIDPDGKEIITAEMNEMKIDYVSIVPTGF